MKKNVRISQTLHHFIAWKFAHKVNFVTHTEFLSERLQMLVFGACADNPVFTGRCAFQEFGKSLNTEMIAFPSQKTSDTDDAEHFGITSS